MGDPETAGRKRLKEAVQRRRAELGLAMDKLPHGPGEVTLHRIESGNSKGGYRAKTLMQLDRSLGWVLGTSQGVLDGSAPGDPSEWLAEPAQARSWIQQHPDARQQSGIASMGVVGHATVEGSVTDTAEASDSATRNVSLGRSTTDSAPASDSVTPSVTTRTDGMVQIEPGAPLPVWAVTTKAGVEFADLLQKHYRDEPETADLTRAVLTFVRRIVNRDA